MNGHLKGPIAAIAAAAALSACSTAQRIGDAVWPFSGEGESSAPLVPEDGRISILSFEQQLTPDPALASQTIATPQPVSFTEWSQPGGVASNAPSNVAGEGTLARAWRSELGDGANRDRTLSGPPVISEGLLFFLDADHRVHAIDAATGNRRWTREMRPEGGEDRRARGGGVAAAGGRVFVTTGFGFIAAIDAANGDEVWRTNGGAPFHSAPVVAGGRVFATTNDSELMAFDAGTGAVQWTHQAIAEPARILSSSSVAVSGESVIAPFASGELTALLAANGRRLWTDSLSRTGRLTSLSAINDIAGRPVVDNGVVYAASHSGVLTAIDLRTGQRIWDRPFASTQTPLIAGDVLYAVSVDGELAAFDRTSGGVYWVRQLRRFEDEEDRENRIAWTGPIMVGGKLILASSLGEVVAVAPQNGTITATSDVEDPVFIPPITANGSIYVVTNEARLVVLR
ncbi:MAG: PQQ-binding-like beta-propeller repeat protein [Hyphomonadaceae bacterium]